MQSVQYDSTVRQLQMQLLKDAQALQIRRKVNLNTQMKNLARFLSIKLPVLKLPVAPIRDGTLEDEEEAYLEPEVESEVASIADSVQESSAEEEPESTVKEDGELLPEEPAAAPEEATAVEPEEPAAAPEEATAVEPEEPAAAPEEATAVEPEEPESAGLSLSKEQEKELDQLSKKTEKIRYLDKLNWEPTMIAEKVDCRLSYVSSTLSKTNIFLKEA